MCYFALGYPMWILCFLDNFVNQYLKEMYLFLSRVSFMFCVCKYDTCVAGPVEARQKSVGFSRTGITDGCELPCQL